MVWGFVTSCWKSCLENEWNLNKNIPSIKTTISKLFCGVNCGVAKEHPVKNTIKHMVKRWFGVLPLRHLFLISNKPKCEKRNNKRNTMNVVFWALFYGIVNSILKKCFKKYACNWVRNSSSLLFSCFNHLLL